MPSIDKRPEKLRPYLFHGLQLEWSEASDEAVGDCPFCGKEGKFSVKKETGLYRCFVCAEGTDKGGGNIYTFIRKLFEASFESTLDYEDLSEERGLLNPDTLMQWGVCRSEITGEWLVPGYSPERKMNQLYKYTEIEGKKRLLPTPTLGHQIFGLNGTFDPKKTVIYVCEGPWDALALWEVMSQTKISGGKFMPTASIQDSLLSNTNIIALPGCETFPEVWANLFSEKHTNLLFDNDHDRKHPKNGKVVESAGYRAMRRHSQMLVEQPKPPKEVQYLQWGKDGERFDPSLPSGYDVRDLLKNAGNALGPRINALNELLSKISPIPVEWLKNDSRGLGRDSKGDGLKAEHCESYATLVNAFRKAMKWTDGLDCGLSVMLASVVSTMQLGDQLWIKIIGPASCGKSTLCEALSVNKEYIIAKSTLRGFFSGYNNGEAGGEDFSLLSQAKGKTLIIKDGDTLLKSPNRDEILSQARDIYDTVSRTSFKNKASKDYEGYRMTMILCGTNSLRELDSSELGERFLDCIIMNGIDDDLEDEILWRVTNKAFRNAKISASDKDPESRQDEETTESMRLTAGYVTYLRKNAERLADEVEVSEGHMEMCTRLGKFVAFMRARPSRTQDEVHEREFAARLVIQLSRLAIFLAVVLNRKSVDDEVMRRVKKVAMDTGRGLTLRIVQAIYRAGEAGLLLPNIANAVNLTEDRTRRLLMFMRQLGIVRVEPRQVNQVRKQNAYVLSPLMYKLYNKVTGEEFEDG